MAEHIMWAVVSPNWDYVEPILEDGSGPTETTCDYVVIEAPNRRTAIVAGVKEMSEWPDIARGDDMNPFTGVKAIRTLCKHGQCQCDACVDDPKAVNEFNCAPCMDDFNTEVARQ